MIHGWKLAWLLAAAVPACGQLVYSSRVYETGGRSRMQLWELNLGSGARRQLTTSERAHLRPRCGPGEIEFQSGSQAVEPFPLEAGERWIWQRATGQERLKGKVTGSGVPSPRAVSRKGDKSAEFTPDGKQVVVKALPSGKELYRVTAPAVSDDWVSPAGVMWSPDGSRLLAMGQAGSSTAHYLDLWLLGGDSRKWTHLAGGNDPAWSPDGRRLFYTTPRTLANLPHGKGQVWVTELRMVELPGGKARTLVSGLSYNAFPTWCGK